MLNNLTAWLSKTPRVRELRETRESWEAAEAAWQASPAATHKLSEFVLRILDAARAQLARPPAWPILIELCVGIEWLLTQEDITAVEPVWERIEGDATVAIAFREMVTRRRRWAANFDKMLAIFEAPLVRGICDLAEHLPEACFGDWDDRESALGVPLADLLDHPDQAIERLLLIPYDDDAFKFDVFVSLRERLATNLLIASGFAPDDNIHERRDRLIMPTKQKGKTPAELSRLYLAGTPFESLLDFPVPFTIPQDARFEHCHIIGGTGHGKTQLLQRLIHDDLGRAQGAGHSVIVIDSQGDLIRKLSRLAVFDRDAPDSLADRLVLIDPSDVEFPASLNLFDAHLDRLSAYTPADRERVLNGVIELYEIFFGAMLGAELTQKQGVIFRYLARLMVAIPGATIHTLMQLMEDGRPFQEHMDRLEGSPRHFFETEFFHPSFAATKKQILRRLWGVLSTPAFERMFAQRQNKLDLFEAMKDGKIVLISTAKDLLKTEGSALFGRFFVALIAQAALERSTLAEGDRTPCYVYIDEAQEYFDDSIETILTQARKYQVGLTLAHQTLDQLSPRLRSAIFANTSLKCAGGVSAKDARALSDELRSTPDFIEAMKRSNDRTEFAVWLKHRTPRAIRVSVPLGYVERQPILNEEALEALLDENRRKYCGTQADVLDFARPQPQPQDAPEPRRRSANAPAAQPEPPPTAPAAPATGRETAAKPVQELERQAAPRTPVAERPARDLGKGGPQHRYVQNLVKELAEARGFRAVIEEPTDGGQIDVALRRDGLTIACEISVTSKADREADHIEKCLRGAYDRIFVIATDQKRLGRIEAIARERLASDSLSRIEFLLPEQLAAALDCYQAPRTETTMVRGYKVKVSRSPTTVEDMQDRRAAMGRVVAQSIRKLTKNRP